MAALGLREEPTHHIMVKGMQKLIVKTSWAIFPIMPLAFCRCSPGKNLLCFQIVPSLHKPALPVDHDPWVTQTLASEASVS